MPEIALAKVSPEAPLDRACLFACGLSTGLGAAMFTAKVDAGSTCVVFGAGMVGLGAVAGARLQGAERIICVDLVRGAPRRSPAARARPTLGRPTATSCSAVLDETRGFGADYTFEATGLVSVMRQAVEAARMGWGLCTVAGVAGKGETLDVVPRLLITGRRVAGSSLRRRQGPRPGAPARAALPRRGHRRRRRSSHTASRSTRSTRVRAHAPAGRDPQRDLLHLT